MSAISELSHLKVNKAKTPEEKAQRRKEASGTTRRPTSS